MSHILFVLLENAVVIQKQIINEKNGFLVHRFLCLILDKNRKELETTANFDEFSLALEVSTSQEGR